MTAEATASGRCGEPAPDAGLEAFCDDRATDAISNAVVGTRGGGMETAWSTFSPSMLLVAALDSGEAGTPFENVMKGIADDVWLLQLAQSGAKQLMGGVEMEQGLFERAFNKLEIRAQLAAELHRRLYVPRAEVAK